MILIMTIANHFNVQIGERKVNSNKHIFVIFILINHLCMCTMRYHQVSHFNRCVFEIDRIYEEIIFTKFDI